MPRRVLGSRQEIGERPAAPTIQPSTYRWPLFSINVCFGFLWLPFGTSGCYPTRLGISALCNRHEQFYKILSKYSALEYTGVLLKLYSQRNAKFHCYLTLSILKRKVRTTKMCAAHSEALSFVCTSHQFVVPVPPLQRQPSIPWYLTPDMWNG